MSERSATEGLLERATDEGLVDVAYAATDSPIGRLLVAATSAGLVRVAFPEQDEDEVLDDLATRVSPRVLEAPARVDRVRRELDEYFEGRRRHFDLDVDLQLVRAAFSRRVLDTTGAIPFGRTRTYADVAVEAGSPRGARAAGNALGANPVPVVVPCHRVLHSGGGLGGYGGGLDRKLQLLSLEGARAVRRP